MMERRRTAEGKNPKCVSETTFGTAGEIGEAIIGWPLASPLPDALDLVTNSRFGPLNLNL